MKGLRHGAAPIAVRRKAWASAEMPGLIRKPVLNPITGFVAECRTITPRRAAAFTDRQQTSTKPASCHEMV